MTKTETTFPNTSPTWLGPRGKLILQTGTWSLVAKIAAAANLFISIPYVLHALGPMQFGVWATLVSLIVFAGFLDFGFGNGTMNLVATAHGSGRNDAINNIVREGSRTLLCVSAVLTCSSLIALPLVPWHRLLGMPDVLATQCREAVACILFTIAIAVPLNLANRVLLGLGQGDRAFRWQALGQALTLAVVITLTKISASLALLTAAAVATPLLASVVNTVMLWRNPLLLARAQRSRDKSIATHIRREGALFFILQIAAALAYSADLPLISALRGPTEAGTYAIVQRYFSVIPLALSLLWAPLWPIYRQALAADNSPWVIRTLRRSTLFATIFAGCAALALGVVFTYIVSFWVQQPLHVARLLIVGCVVWCIIDAFGTSIATFFNAASIMRYQIVVACLFASTCVTAKAWAIHQFGIVAIPWTTVVTYCLLNLIPTLVFGPRLVASALSRPY